MRARVSIPRLRSEQAAHTIIRNLSRILDIKIIDMDSENGYLTFVYETKFAFNKVKYELMRIGYPMKKTSGNKVLADLETPVFGEAKGNSHSATI